MKKHKAIRSILLSSFLLLQIVFMIMIAKENLQSDTLSSLLLVLLVSLTLLFGYLHTDLHHEEYSYEKTLVVVWVLAGAITCHLLTTMTDLGSVISTGITGVLGSLLPIINKKSDYLKKLPSAIYCGAFIGMSSMQVSPSIDFIIVAGFFTCIILMMSKNLFLGFGGKLGTIAFFGVALASIFFWILK